MPNLERKPVIEECKGCGNVEGLYCRIWAAPVAKWRLGRCPSATHLKLEIREPEQKVRVGQQKQKKKVA